MNDVQRLKELEQLLKLKNERSIRQARKSFFAYCNTKAGDFYKPDRQFLVDFCNQLQDFYYSDDEVFIVNMPPRHGKSRTIGCFVEWVLGQNQSEKIMTGSYNETLSTNFTKTVRDTIAEEKAMTQKLFIPIYFLM